MYLLFLLSIGTGYSSGDEADKTIFDKVKSFSVNFLKFY
jgi:hypothetical protein